MTRTEYAFLKSQIALKANLRFSIFSTQVTRTLILCSLCGVVALLTKDKNIVFYVGTIALGIMTFFLLFTFIFWFPGGSPFMRKKLELEKLKEAFDTGKSVDDLVEDELLKEYVY